MLIFLILGLRISCDDKSLVTISSAVSSAVISYSLGLVQYSLSLI